MSRFLYGPLDWAQKDSGPTTKEQSRSCIDDLVAWQDQRRRTIHLKGLGPVVLEPKKKQPKTLADLVVEGLSSGAVQKPQPGSLAETVQNRVLELLNPTGSRTKDVKPGWRWLQTSEGEQFAYLEKAKKPKRSIWDIMLDNAPDDLPEDAPLQRAITASLRKLGLHH